MAVHARPAAFEGSDGLSYSVEIDIDETTDTRGAFAAFFVFVRWSRGEPRVTGHIESDYLAFGTSDEAVRAAIGALSIEEAKRVLDAVIAERGPATDLPAWDIPRGDHS
ncbi:MAG TPA: hypothetical protein VIW69_10665 [Candidatus Elarobacter sp.]